MLVISIKLVEWGCKTSSVLQTTTSQPELNYPVPSKSARDHVLIGRATMSEPCPCGRLMTPYDLLLPFAGLAKTFKFPSAFHRDTCHEHSRLSLAICFSRTAA